MSYEYISGPWSPYYYDGATVESITVHHAAGTDFDAIGRTFQRSQTSAHYGVAPGKVAQYVEEGKGAWHCGASGNMTSIGIECVNSTGEPDWGVDERTIDTLCELMADIATRNGLLPLEFGRNVFGHKDWSATFCPGVLYDRLPEICERANALAGQPHAKPSIGGNIDEEEEMAAIYWFPGGACYRTDDKFITIQSQNQLNIIKADYYTRHGRDIPEFNQDNNWLNELRAMFPEK